MSEPRIIATIRGPDELLAYFRARFPEINVTLPAADRLAGYSDGSNYVAKILCGDKRLTIDSLFDLMPASAGVIVIAEDLEALRYIAGKGLRRHKAKDSSARNSIRSARKLAIAKWSKVGAAERAEIARKMNDVRWADNRRRKAKRKAALVRWDMVKAVAKGVQE